MDTFAIPTVDISGFLLNKPEADSVVKAFHDAANTCGFMQITGHGVPMALQERVLNESRKFFQLSEQDKAQCLPGPGSDPMRGYEKMRSQTLESLEDEVVPDEKEAFTIRRDTAGGERIMQGANIWPSGQPSMNECFTEYFDAVSQVSEKLFSILALSLDLPATYFDHFSTDPDGINTLRALHYPPLPDNVKEPRRGIGAHTDFGALTILLQDSVGGLQVYDRKQDLWRDVVPKKDAFVVNIGDMIQRWTNGRFKSTLHRVGPNMSGQPRYSCPFFVGGPLDQVIDSLCGSTTEKPFTVEEHLKSRFAETYRAVGIKV